ncbi:LuxR C-terminal-related transcriptional regulator [Virgibacillus siamensis]|uniref:LuxR C-terminal-related transcriptional regulator n=1 Tax=Virgibacillus siamensis TaxID=480071 RepID=UPI0009875E29|nr:response regulator transcription factor [Virgibacillus siamensis]
MKVVIVDDFPLIRIGLASALGLDDTFDIAGEAGSYEQAVELFAEVNPEIVLVGAQLADESRFDLITELMNQGTTCKFIILTSSTCELDFRRARELGVDGYLLKEAYPEELLHAIKVVSKGRKYYDPSVMDFVINAADHFAGEEYQEKLTPKEMEILIELGKGYSNRQISKSMFITEYTVKKHVSQILAKLALTDRTQAALYANAKGFVQYVIS